MSKLAKIISVIKDEVMGSIKRARIYKKMIKSIGEVDDDCFGIDPAFDDAFKNKDQKQKESDD